MKVVAVKLIEKYRNRWAVPYTRQHGKHGREAYFFFDTQEEAKQKYKQLLDSLINHDGVYIGSKEKRKKTSSRKPDR